MKTIALQKQKKRTDYQTDPYQSNQKLNSQYHTHEKFCYSSVRVSISSSKHERFLHPSQDATILLHM